MIWGARFRRPPSGMPQSALCGAGGAARGSRAREAWVCARVVWCGVCVGGEAAGVGLAPAAGEGPRAPGPAVLQPCPPLLPTSCTRAARAGWWAGAVVHSERPPPTPRALQSGSVCKRQALAVALLGLRLQPPVAQLGGAKGACVACVVAAQRADVADVRKLRLHNTPASLSRQHLQRIAQPSHAHCPKPGRCPALGVKDLHVSCCQPLVGRVVVQGLVRGVWAVRVVCGLCAWCAPHGRAGA